MLRFESHGVKGGLWRGQLTGDARPARVVLTHHADIIATAQLTEAENGWRVELPVPAAAISDGVQTLVLVADNGDADEPTRPDSVILSRLPLLAGRPLDEDLLAEIAALRAELELVKRELRRLGASVSAG